MRKLDILCLFERSFEAYESGSVEKFPLSQQAHNIAATLKGCINVFATLLQHCVPGGMV